MSTARRSATLIASNNQPALPMRWKKYEEIKHFSQLWYHFSIFLHFLQKASPAITGTFTSHQLTATCRPDLADALQGSQQHGGRTDGLWIRQNSETARLRDLENLPLIWCCFGYIYIYIYNIYMMVFYHYIILYPYINIINILGKTRHVFLLKHFAKTARSAMIFPGKYPSLKLRANAAPEKHVCCKMKVPFGMAMYGLFSRVNSLLVSGSAQSKWCLFHIGYISFIRKYQFGTTKLCFFFIGPSILGEKPPTNINHDDFKQLYFSSWRFIGCYLHMVAHLSGVK